LRCAWLCRRGASRGNTVVRAATAFRLLDPLRTLDWTAASRDADRRGHGIPRGALGVAAIVCAACARTSRCTPPVHSLMAIALISAARPAPCRLHIPGVTSFLAERCSVMAPDHCADASPGLAQTARRVMLVVAWLMGPTRWVDVGAAGRAVKRCRRRLLAGACWRACARQRRSLMIRACVARPSGAPVPSAHSKQWSFPCMPVNVAWHDRNAFGCGRCET